MERRPGEGSRTGILEEGVKPKRVESIHGASHSVIELTTSMVHVNVDKNVVTKKNKESDVLTFIV